MRVCGGVVARRGDVWKCGLGAVDMWRLERSCNRPVLAAVTKAVWARRIVEMEGWLWMGVWLMAEIVTDLVVGGQGE